MNRELSDLLAILRTPPVGYQVNFRRINKGAWEWEVRSSQQTAPIAFGKAPNFGGAHLAAENIVSMMAGNSTGFVFGEGAN